MPANKPENTTVIQNKMEKEESLLVGLFGYPIHHSKSPAMHNAAFQAMDINGFYQAFSIEPKRLEEAVQAIRTLKLRGVNVTIPHKVAIIPFLDELTLEAQLIGAVNTVIHENGRLIGTNTDGIGYVKSLREAIEIDLKSTTVLILGAGGAARAIATQLALEGVRQIFVTNRTMEKAKEIVSSISAVHPQAQAIAFSEIEQRITEMSLVVNTTSVGMYPNSNESPLPMEWLQKQMIVSDLVYNPRQTLLLRQAREKGCRTLEGIGMLLYQGAEAFQLWTGQQPPVAVMRNALLRAL